ncbi:hypothetical protein JN531_005715 [Flagellatimonas centrodinii]|uniref:DUF6933 domain-containing protein n=1 Tax=Flagellatimonas centrodinii TaxID=2806210 RepID=UPI001FEE8015|nr:hypothetical protein [Flagellatimonas centrodinii]ULQ47786.1 hypothetical protein JN531_005715 [Flagellatimonas centrodinii]
MTVLRCTAKLLKAMRTPWRAGAAAEETVTRLGDWTANLIQAGRKKVILVMNDQTRHLVVIDAAPFATVPQRFLLSLHKSLVTLGVPADLAADEIAGMKPVLIEPAKSRSVLSAISQVAWRLELEVRDGMRSAEQLTNYLSDNITTINGKLDFPIDHVRKAFGLEKGPRAKGMPGVTLQ